MKRTDRKIIIVFLIIIIILSSILLYKVNNAPDYNQELYNQVYSEYNEMLEHIESIEDNESNNIILIGDSEKNTENIAIGQDENKLTGDEIVIAYIRISKINIFYPIIANTTMENLNVAPTKLCGANPNEIGNFCVIGHNMRNQKHFSNLKKLERNDIIEIMNIYGKTIQYSVYDSYTVKEDDLSCTNQDTNGKREVTLITCTNNKKKRLVVKCREVEK